MGIQTHYYALIDFEGFKNVIDTLGGITIDVPETIHDVTYPNGK
jgi:anionic cell wall polymer biosynthesis LytR-Cps2A-Psr (LCP) family protein